ncbi:MAG: ADP-glyceromanno-heptose 6-epimerase [Bacteroidia bacterium]|nr:ADP-glyceromanno-heptose 6-epimerase [Bacteroidia bacterium]
MIILTGAAGFIGSCMLAKLNQEGYKDIVLVDDFSNQVKFPNYKDKSYSQIVPRTELFEWLSLQSIPIQVVIHLGARTDTTEKNKAIFDELNLNYSKRLWEYCTEQQIPFVYASSAATYGDGSLGFDDDESRINTLLPLNPYGQSKHDFDCWALSQEQKPYFWAGLKFFNVYGPNEYHKGRMASVIFHAFKQIQEAGYLKLFRSHHPEYADGAQLRDFIYVKDVTDVILFLINTRYQSGIYNLGAGQAQTFLALGEATFAALGLKTNIRFIDIPLDIRDSYQYFTQANMHRLRSIGYHKPFTTLEAGVQDYVQQYLLPQKYW